MSARFLGCLTVILILLLIFLLNAAIPALVQSLTNLTGQLP